ncbi:MAG TPA: RodZ domain-containing protein [Xanthomonadaceae bacterium]|nr:RodZ domain-containing protein [Xanthomonadaceae bacterium]
MIDHASEGGESLGRRLRAARLARDLGVAEAAARLRLPVALVEAMEADDHARLGAWVYARGYLISYASLVGVPVVAVDAIRQRVAEAPPPLQATTRTSRSHLLLDRYLRRAVYLVLTAAIVLPVVFFARLERLDVRHLTLQPLDPAVELDADAPATPAEDQGEQPVVASMTPFYLRQADAGAVGPPALPGAAIAAVADSRPGVLTIRLTSPSWVEIVGRDGARLEYGLLEAGVERSFPVGSVKSISIGNADAIRVAIDGEPVDLEPFRRANVARFELSSSGQPTPVDG